MTDRTRSIAYIPVGYADGYRRGLSNRGTVLIRGYRCPVVGRVCMEWILSDVTDLPGVRHGEEVVLLGSEGGQTVSADEMADLTGTIPYEILCGISEEGSEAVWLTDTSRISSFRSVILLPSSVPSGSCS